MRNAPTESQWRALAHIDKNTPCSELDAKGHRVDALERRAWALLGVNGWTLTNEGRAALAVGNTIYAMWKGTP